MANSQSTSKGNGASTRMANPKHGITRARSWDRGQIRKIEHASANLALHQEKVANGGLGRRERRRKALKAAEVRLVLLPHRKDSSE